MSTPSCSAGRCDSQVCVQVIARSGLEEQHRRLMKWRLGRTSNSRGRHLGQERMVLGVRPERSQLAGARGGHGAFERSSFGKRRRTRLRISRGKSSAVSAAGEPGR